MQPTLFYAVAKHSLKKIQANNVSITLMIFFAFFSSSCASNNESHQFILSVYFVGVAYTFDGKVNML